MPLKDSSFGYAQLQLHCRALQSVMASLHVDPVCQRMQSHTGSAAETAAVIFKFVLKVLLQQFLVLVVMSNFPANLPNSS